MSFNGPFAFRSSMTLDRNSQIKHLCSKVLPGGSNGI